MSQRVFFLVIVSESPQACDWFAGVLPRARSGPLVVSADPAASLARKEFFEALCEPRRVVCAVGNEWLGALPRRFRGLAVGENARGHLPKVLPRARASYITQLLEEAPAREPKAGACVSGVAELKARMGRRVNTGLAELKARMGRRVNSQGRKALVRSSLDGEKPCKGERTYVSESGDAPQAGALHRLNVARKLILCEPWDVFSLWLPLPDTDLPQAGQELSEILTLLTPDTAVCGVLLNRTTGVPPVAGPHGRDARGTSGAPNCRWFWRLQKGGCEPLPPRPVEDVLPTLVTVLGISVPPALPGIPVDLQRAGAPSGYTPEDERAIQKRLEDLGYI